MITILSGRQSDPLQEKILDQAVNNYIKHPEQETFIIVPNHIKFTTEVSAINKVAILRQTSETTVKNLQILSFSRLAWYFLKDNPELMPKIIDDAAATMLLAQIIQDKQNELLLFHDNNVNNGLLKQLYQTLLDIKSGNFDLDNCDENNLDLETKNKIHDLNIINEEFTKKIAERFTTKDELLHRLLEALNRSDKLKQANFYFTDFSHFSLQEMMIVKLLARKAQKFVIAFQTQNGLIKNNIQTGDYDYIVQTTIQTLTRYLQNNTLSYQIKNYPVSQKPTNREKLNSIWARNINQDLDLHNFVQLVRADSRYAEAYFVARTIYQQVALGNYRYRDFLVLAPNMQEYETYLTPILRKNKLPFFNDLQQQMKYHPLVIVIESLNALLTRKLYTPSILAIMKTKLIIPDWYHSDAEYVHDLDLLENFVLAHGINYKLWKRSFKDFVDAQVIRIDKQEKVIERLDKLREYFVKQITSILDTLQNQTDPQKAVTSFFDFLIKNGIPEQLNNWRTKASEIGDLQAAQQPEQLWSLLLQLLQDYLLINEHDFELTDFFNVLISGFKEANFAQIPSTLDAVVLSEMGMVQPDSYKQVFIIGATSNNLPKIEKTPGFLNSENLVALNNDSNDTSYLEDHQSLNNLDQDYQFGLKLALAHDRVYISYPVLNANNEQLMPSLYFNRLTKFASIFEQHDLPNEDASDLLSFMTNPDASLGYLSFINPGKMKDELISLTDKYLPEKTEKIIEAEDFDNQPEQITPELAQKLYGNELNSSVSQLETYYQNSFEYFLNYGLRLHPRFENELGVIEAGNYFHETFDRLVKLLHENKLDLSNLSKKQLQDLLMQARIAMQDEGRYRQLLNDPFNKFLFNSLDRTTSKVAFNWQSSLKNTPFRPQYSELSFGNHEKLQGLKFELPNQKIVDLRGKIDRVDLAPGNGHILGQIIDYKSSQKQFELGLFANGIALQMVSYLDVLTKNDKFFSKNERLALLGAFYQTVTKQVDRLNSDKLINTKFEIKPENEASKPKLMYKGLIVDDPKLLVEAEPLLDQSDTKSQIYDGLKTKKKGGFSLPTKRAFNEKELEQLLNYDEYLIKHAANEILSGQIALNPYKYGQQTGLQYSDYKDIFFFDAMMPQNKYHIIKNLDKKAFFEQIKDDLEKGEEKDNG